jgi:hypothetical protein
MFLLLYSIPTFAGLDRCEVTLHSTDQEMDHDSIYWLNLRRNDDFGVQVGHYEVLEDHGTDLRDGRSVTHVLHLNPGTCVDITDSRQCNLEIRMQGYGNNKWHFTTDVKFKFTDGKVQACYVGQRELNSRGSRIVRTARHCEATL